MNIRWTPGSAQSERACVLDDGLTYIARAQKNYLPLTEKYNTVMLETQDFF